MTEVAERGPALALAVFTPCILAFLVAGGVRVIQDDAYYYLKIAQNIAAGRGSTFDGLHPTNGYHPLWLISLVPLFWIEADRFKALTLVMVLQSAVALGGTLAVYAAARLSLGAVASTLAALVWFGLTYKLSLSGLEFGLHALGLAATAGFYRRHFTDAGTAGASAHAGLGVLLGLVFLARLDTLLLAAVVGLAVSRDTVAGQDRRSLTLLALLWGPVVVCCAAYVTVNVWAFDSPFPVSGSVKRMWSDYLLTQDPHYLGAGWLVAKAAHLTWPLRNLADWPVRGLLLGSLGAGLLLLVHAAGWRPGPLSWCVDRVLRPWSPFVVFSVAQIVMYGLLYHGWYSFTTWYYAAQPLLAALMAGAAAEWLWSASAPASAQGRRRRLLGRGLVLAACCAMAVGTLSSARRMRRLHARFWSWPIYHAAAWTRENLPAKARIGAWNAGVIGYFSERQVVNLDGLVNTRRYFEFEQYDLCAYWDKTGITHLVDSFDPAGPKPVPLTLPVTAFYARCLDRLEVLWSERAHGFSSQTRVYRYVRPVRAADDATR
jgi:hypothetical protein